MLEVLKGNGVQLELLNLSHKNELYAIAQDESIWSYSSSKAFGELFYPWFDKALDSLQAKKHLPFAVRRLCDQKLIGSTRFYDINMENHRLTIGYTWYVPEVWGSNVNPECKYLLLNYAFETLQVNRVEFAIDSRHSHSRAAIKKLGAIEEGVLRKHMVLMDGFVRDTAIFSITKPEWPTVKLNLETRLKNFN